MIEEVESYNVPLPNQFDGKLDSVKTPLSK